MPTLPQLRAFAITRQAALCIYCGRPMCTAATDLAAYAKRHGMTLPQANQRLATAEHLQARSEGGRNTRANIAAACLGCNRWRHRLRVPPSPKQFAAYVRKRLARTATGAGEVRDIATP